MRRRSLAWLRKVRPDFGPRVAVGRRLHREDADRVDVFVRVASRVGSLIEPVRAKAGDGGIERVEIVEATGPVGAAGEGRGHLPAGTTPLG